MKAKTKKRIIHIVHKKRLVSRKTSKRVLRSFLIGLATISVGSLAYAITLNKPTVTVALNAGGGQVKLEADNPVVQPNSAALNSPVQFGISSWYAWGLPDPDALTCASRTFPRGTYLLVTDRNNDRTVTCLVDDYGPAIWTGRVIDLSRGSFEQVASLGEGTIPVSIAITSPPSSMDLPIYRTVYSAVVGYDLCQITHSTQYCNDHRTDQK